MKVSEINVAEALQKSIEISKKEVEMKDKFSTYAPIYLAPTSNVKDTVNLYKEAKKALVVGSQGAYIFELLLNGVTEIDCFDKNILQYFYYELLKTSIQYDDYKDFIMNFTSIRKSPISQKINLMLTDDMFMDLLGKMEDPARSYWKNLFMNYDVNALLPTNLFRLTYYVDAPFLRGISSIYNPDSFYELKSILNNKDVKVDYHICDIGDIHKEFHSNMYDLIMLDNILQYYKSIPTLDNIVLVNKFVKEKLDPMLNEGGQIQLGYGFEVIADAVSKILQRPYYHMSGLLDIMAQKQIDEAIKEDFIPNMIKKYDQYTLDFIKGVEEDYNHKAENVVLTYKK